MIDPMTPADADLQDFPFMPLHVARLRDSDLAAEAHPEACWYAVLLWSASWHQLPAGSLPVAEAVLTKLCGLGRDTRTFRRHRTDALRGWVEASDGRLYHPVVAEQVIAGWESKLRQRHRTECATIKKRNDRNNTAEPRPTFVEWLSLSHPGSVPFLSLGTDDNVPRDIASKGQGQGQRDSIGDDGRAGASSDLTAALPVWDAVELADHVARIAGVRHLEPGRISENITSVREWLQAGADPPMIATVIQQGRSSAPAGIHSLKYFDTRMRGAIARRDHPDEPSRSDPTQIRDPLLRRYLENGGTMGD